MKNINVLKNKHKDYDIWVLGAGASLNYIDPSFFENKYVVGTNRICNHFYCDYVIAKDKRGFHLLNDSINPDVEIVVSEKDCGAHEMNDFSNADYFFKHNKNKGKLNIKDIPNSSDSLVVSNSTITSAIHFAAHLGASNIIIAGHDCGKFKGKDAINGYHDKIKPTQNEKEYHSFLNEIHYDTSLIINYLKSKYKVNIHSLNPFFSLKCLGNSFQTFV